MAKQKWAKTLRPGGRWFEVYNEGLCVYLHDAGNTDKLAKLIRKHGEEGNTFFDNLEVVAFAKAVSRNALALAYELPQDDEVFVEIHVGAPLTSKELAAARWLSPQRARLSLPTGKLRIDTPNTMPLDHEDHEDEPALVDVPPGDYVLTIYRVDWKATEVDELPYKGPQEVLVLTPEHDADPVPKGPPILEFPTPAEETGWKGAYAIEGRKFTCQVNFWDYWEWIRVNLEPDAIKQLGMRCGSVLRLKAVGTLFDLIYIDDMTLEDYRTRLGGRASFEKRFADRAEVGLGGWQMMDDRRVLAFFRFKATKSIPLKYHETWTPASGEVLEESYPPPVAAQLDEATVHKGVIKAAVVFANEEMLVVNARAQHIDELGKRFKLKLPHGVHTVSFGDHDRHGFNYFMTSKEEPRGLHFLRAMGLRSFARKGKIPKWAKAHPVEEIPTNERSPVTAFFPPATADPLSNFLQVRQMYVEGNYRGFDWPAPPPAGTVVEIFADPV